MRQPTFQEYIRLCKEADALIRDLLVKSTKLQGRRPKTLKAAAVHYLAGKKRLHVTLNDIFHIYGCYTDTIIRVEKIVRDLADLEKEEG